MKSATLMGLALVTGLAAHGTAFADWRPGGSEWKQEYRDGPCKVKEESKRDEYKREVKCKDGYGARWGGEYKREFHDGPCKVKIEAKRDEYKEEIKCN
jgi:hypothetical protein